MSLVESALARVLPAVPRSVVRRVASPYIAGSTLADAERVVAGLSAEGLSATVDVLGEEIRQPGEAEAIGAAYHDTLRMLADGGHPANISIKLTALGLELDGSLCERLVRGLVEDAAARGRFVRIDMEDSSTVDRTLALYCRLRADGHDNVGVVLQSVLRRTVDDIAALAELRPWVRLCKGIYVEPAAIAFTDADMIRRSFVSCLDRLIDVGSRVAVATHDEQLIQAALARVGRLAEHGYELQMLLGVRGARARELATAGHRVRIYVPYGQRWYEYSLRRLQENPALATTIAKATLGRALGRPA